MAKGKPRLKPVLRGIKAIGRVASMVVSPFSLNSRIRRAHARATKLRERSKDYFSATQWNANWGRGVAQAADQKMNAPMPTATPNRHPTCCPT